jgi:hypothetical protein
MPDQQPIHTPVVETSPEKGSEAYSIDTVLTKLEDNLRRLEEFLETQEGFPEWWSQEAINFPQLKKAIRETSDPDVIVRCIHLLMKERELKYKATNRPSSDDDLLMVSLEHEVGEQNLAIGFQHEAVTGPLHLKLLETLDQASNTETSTNISTELEMLRGAYGLQTKTELLGLKGDNYEDTVRKYLLNENALFSIRQSDQDEVEGWEESKESLRRWMRKALVAAINIDELEADNYVFAASRKQLEKAKILEIINKFETFGVARIRKITQFSGVYAVADYTTEQLEQMEKLAIGDQEEIKKLQDHDVIVSAINRMGDHNGTLSEVSRELGDDHRRTLFFEITSMADIYKVMLKLKGLGIKPSTLVLAAHSAAGQFIVSDDRDIKSKRNDIATIASRRLVEMVNDDGSLGEGNFAYALHGSRGFKRIIDELMVSSRSLDDAPQDKGRKKIIFQACYAASEAPVRDVDEVSGEKIQLDMESVVSQLGNDLLEQEVSSIVDIYGAEGGIRMRGTQDGLRYTSQPSDLDSERSDFNATKISVENGHVQKSVVAEIALRKSED